MAEELKNDALMNALKKRTDFLNSLPPDRRQKMIEFQKNIDEALDRVPENERLELIYRMMVNQADNLINQMKKMVDVVLPLIDETVK